MPNKALLLNVLGIALQYGLVIIIYYFLLRVAGMIYSDLKAAAGSLQTAAPAATFKSARLLVVDSGSLSLAENSFPIGETLSIGRNVNNDIAINDGFVSYEHACINYDRQLYWLADLNSTNGTLLNGKRVTDEIPLNSGDLITIGPVTLKFER